MNGDSHLSIAIVGHSNVGKTSLVAALTRDARLRVEERPGTTLASYERIFEIGGTAVLGFVDTPGFETANRINEWLDGEGGGGSDAPDGRALVERFVADPGSSAEFPSEVEALRGALGADLLAYVADVTTPPTGQQRQEVRLLRRLGLPLLAILNVLSDEDRSEAWVELLHREGIDMVIPLDAHQFPAEQEQHFYTALAAVRPEHRGRFDDVRELRAAKAASDLRTSASRIAASLIDSLSFRLEQSFSSRRQAMKARAEANERFKRLLRQRETQLFGQLAETYGFGGLEVAGGGLSVKSWSGAWQEDLFDPAALKRYGASAGSVGVAGAVGGSLIDGVGGMGLGTVLGGAAGVAAGLLLGRRVSVRVDGAGALRVGPVDTVQFPSILLNRAVDCWKELEARSHARRDRLELPGAGTDEQRLSARGLGRLSRLARRIRKRPEWCGVETSAVRSPERDRTADELAQLVAELLEASAASTSTDKSQRGVQATR